MKIIFMSLRSERRVCFLPIVRILGKVEILPGTKPPGGVVAPLLRMTCSGEWLMIGQLLQDGKRLLLASISILTAGSHTGWTSIRAGTLANEFKGAGDQVMVQFKEFLAK